jgi:carbon-monoxide dehydrogenase large subunit
VTAIRSVIGDAPKRREDLRFVTGSGLYLGDLAFEGLAHAVVLRSPHAHARIERVLIERARAEPGVLTVLTIEDVRADGLKPLRPSAEANVQTGEKFAFAPQPLLADGKVRYVGEPVALIVAETHAQALDAAERVEVDYSPLPAVTTAAAARAPGSPEISSEVPGNLCFDWRTGDPGAVEAAFAAAAHIVELRLDNHRIVTNPIEPRGVIGLWDPEQGRYTAHASSQSIHATRDNTARALGVAPAAVRFVAPDVGGGFGAKNFIYPEHVLTPWAAKRVGRPVKWIASRSEVFLADHQARDHLADAALALDAEGRFLALRVSSLANVGAYMVSAGGVQTFQYVHLPGTVYRIPAIDLQVAAVLTNTAPIGVTRGPGFAEAVNIIERLIDAAARQCGFDRAKLRRINMVPDAAMPVTNAVGNTVDSGAFAETFDQALARADIDGFAMRRRESERADRCAASASPITSRQPGAHPPRMSTSASRPTARCRWSPAPRLSVRATRRRFRRSSLTASVSRTNASGWCRATPTGSRSAAGHGSSRATYMGGTAIWQASEEIIAKGTRTAAEALEAAEADLRFADGRFEVSGTDRAIALLDVAALARDKGTPLDTYHAWTRQWMTFPNGAHVVEVEIDRDTGQVTLARYTTVDDYGVLVNPMIATGQAHGAIAQGVGQARTRGLRSGFGPAGRRFTDGLRAPARRRSPAIRSRLQRHPLHDQPPRGQRLRRGRRRWRFPGCHERDPRRTRAARDKRFRRPGDPGAHLARD